MITKERINKAIELYKLYDVPEDLKAQNLAILANGLIESEKWCMNGRIIDMTVDLLNSIELEQK